jgi:hypothetical protein
VYGIGFRIRKPDDEAGDECEQGENLDPEGHENNPVLLGIAFEMPLMEDAEPKSNETEACKECVID